MEVPMTPFGELRIQAGLSLGQVARRAGVSAETERRAHRGVPVPRSEAEKLVKALGQLLGGDLPPSMVEDLVAGKRER
jgi:transcriptional regulator with XRE-family HTH domain